jgi:hypothetical protein
VQALRCRARAVVSMVLCPMVDDRSAQRQDELGR